MSESQIAAIVEACRRPEGTFEFTATYPGLHDPAQSDGILFELVAGAHVLRLAREESRLLRGYHSSPGTGTRVATIELAAIAPAEGLHVFLMWSPDELKVVVGEAGGARLIETEGEPSPLQLWAGTDGRVWEIGGGATVFGARVYSDGASVISPPAIELWRTTLLATDLLISGESAAGYLEEAVRSNAALSMLITGYETYAQRRFSEIEMEGTPADAERLVQKCGTRGQRDLLRRGGLAAALLGLSAGSPYVSAAIAGEINFQNFERCKAAYAAAYGIRFGRDLGISIQLIRRVRRLILYRHRVVHVSPLLGTLNLPEVPPEEPEFANKAFASDAKASMERFINALHSRTLRLRPPDRESAGND